MAGDARCGIAGRLTALLLRESLEDFLCHGSGVQRAYPTDGTSLDTVGTQRRTVAMRQSPAVHGVARFGVVVEPFGPAYPARSRFAAVSSQVYATVYNKETTPCQVLPR